MLSDFDFNLILLGRNKNKGTELINRLKKLNPTIGVEFINSDFIDGTNIINAANVIKNKYKKIDILINNAGSLFMRRLENKEGLEITYAVNHQSYFSLTNLLLPLLTKSDFSKIINVSSNAHMGAKILFKDIQMINNYNGWTAYKNSKLYNLLFTFHLAKKLNGSNVTVNALHPGFVKTNFGSNNNIFSKIMIKSAMKMFAIPVEDAAKKLIYLINDDITKKVTGKYFVNNGISNVSNLAKDSKIATNLWIYSKRIMDNINQ